jgi:hypothetical protein
MTKLVLMGTPMGLGVSGERRQQAIDFVAHWDPIVLARAKGEQDLATLSSEDQGFWHSFNVPAMAAWVRAMLVWPVVAPTDFLCPSLWLLGSKDNHAMITLEQYRDAFEDSRVQVEIIEGLDHNQVFDEVEPALSIMLAFTQSSGLHPRDSSSRDF